VDFFECNSALEYVGALTALSFLYDSRNQMMIEHFLEKSARAAYYNNYEGKWIVVRDILQTKHFNFHRTLNVLTEYFTPEEFYGNLVPLIRRMGKSVRFRPWHQRSVAPVKWPQRKRGYTDKGSSTPLHERRLTGNDSTRLSQLAQIRIEQLGEMPYYYRPPESTLFSNKISGYLTNKLSSLYDELIKLEEELENEHKLKQEIDRRIRAVKKRLRKTKS
jgi:hypothetical protein